MRRLLLLSMLMTELLGAHAQEEPEYKLEAGGGLGMVSYEGDFNSNILKNMEPMFSLVAKYRYNPRSAMGVNLSYGKLKGAWTNTKTWYPEMRESMAFDNQLMEVTLRYEYNFWAYGTGREYRGARPVAPFIGLGIGATYVKAAAGGVFAMNLPIGAGIKFKIGPRLNLTAEWAMRFTGSDKLDGVSDPYGIKSSGLFKNTDCYSDFRATITYDMWAKCKTCNNDRF